jgi:hypothetical protein
MISNYKCSGEIADSPYFWGDICHHHINQIRLYRTRCINTLKKNPSMPYFCPQRPFVNGWFSATKRSLNDCAQKEEQEKLVRENGLTVLYQYLHRYARPNGQDLNGGFVNAVEMLLSNNSIKIDTVSTMLGRLRVIQGMFFFYHRNFLWLVNTNGLPVKSLQIIFDQPPQIRADKCKITIVNSTADITDIPANAIIQIKSDKAIKIHGRRSFATNGRKTICQKIANAKMFLNLSDTEWHVHKDFHIDRESFFLESAKSGTGLPILSNLPVWEELSLLLGQLGIVAREILVKGRSLNTAKYLDDSKEIKLENHDNW